MDDNNVNILQPGEMLLSELKAPKKKVKTRRGPKRGNRDSQDVIDPSHVNIKLRAGQEV